MRVGGWHLKQSESCAVLEELCQYDSYETCLISFVFMKENRSETLQEFSLGFFFCWIGVVLHEFYLVLLRY